MSKFSYRGTYTGQKSSLPSHEKIPGSVQLRETVELEKAGSYIQVLALIILLPLLLVLLWNGGIRSIRIWGILLSVLTLLPHELLHGLCFDGEAWIFSNWKDGVFFVTGPGEFSRTRFLITALLPNIVFGFLPFFIFLLFPIHTILGTMGCFCLAAGAGDYLIMYQVLSQVPANARIYSIGNETWWYIPTDTKAD